MGTQVRAIASVGRQLYGKRSSMRLSDGTLAMAVFDNNKNTVAGDFGDNTNVSKIYIYTAPTDGSVWTLRASITTDVTGAGYSIYSAAIGPDNNIHVAWLSANNSLMYNMVSYAAGPAYTVGTTRTLFSVTGTDQCRRLDIDVLGNSGQNAVVTAYNSSISGTLSASIRTYVVVGGGTSIFNPLNIPTMAGKYGKAGTEDITVSACKDAIVSNVATFAMITTRCPHTVPDLGDRLDIVQVNVSTGALITNSAQGILNAGQGAGLRKWTMFCCDGSRTFTAVAVYNDTTSTVVAWKFSINSGVVKTDIIPYTTTLLGTGQTGAGGVARGGGSLVTASCAGPNDTLIHFMNANFVYTCAVDTSGTVAIFNRNVNYWDSPTYLAGSISGVMAGSQRNLGTNYHDVLYYLGWQVYSAVYQGWVSPSAPINVSPPAGVLVKTDRPTLSAVFRNPRPSLQLREKMRWQLATDAGFTTNVKNIIQPDTALQLPSNTDPAHALLISAAAAVDASTELFQNTWYLRAAVMDELGNSGPWSVVNSWVLSHTPVGTNLLPTGGSIYLYGAGSVVFDWDFSDPSPYDFQTAYEIFVVNAATGATLVDTGKITSGNTMAAVTLPPAAKDIELQWYIILWDSDDVSGLPSGSQSFFVSDAPAPTITAPTDLSSVTTSVPTISWNSGVGGVKAQAAYRVVITQGTTIRWDTSWVPSANSAVNVPAGILFNSQSYTITLTVRDSLNLEGSTTSRITVALTPPAAVDLTRVYMYEFDRRGFLYIGWRSTNMDATQFTSWNLYRKAIGEATWTLLFSTSEIRSSYGFRDYGARASTQYQYAVTQMIQYPGGDIVESPRSAVANVTTPTSSYWLLDPLGVLQPVPLYLASADTFTDEQESASFTVLGRGRHVDIGDSLGYNGTLTLQLRDKYVGLSATSNCFLNPSFELRSSANVPANWVFTGNGSYGNINTDYWSFYEPAPNGKLLSLAVQSDALATTASDYLQFAQDVIAANMPVTPGQTFTHSQWTASDPDSTSVGVPNYKSVVTYYNSSNGVISTETLTMNQVDTYEPTNLLDTGTGNWKRVSALHTAPAGTDHINVAFRIFTSVSGKTGVMLGGAQLEKGAISTMFDGSSNGAIWSADAYVSPSVSSGTYTAHKQRADIGLLFDAKLPLYLRSPYGDVIYIVLNGPSFSRMAGVTADFGELSLPYLEVAL